MEEGNLVFELLKGLVQKGDSINLHFNGKFYTLADKELPINAGVRFVRDQMAALQRTVKEAASAATSQG